MPRVQKVQEQIVAPLPKELRAVFAKCLRIIGSIEDEE